MVKRLTEFEMYILHYSLFLHSKGQIVEANLVLEQANIYRATRLVSIRNGVIEFI